METTQEQVDIVALGPNSYLWLKNTAQIHILIHTPNAGVVDPDFTGSVCMLLMNFSSQDHVIEKNHCIAQMILEKVAYPVICEVSQILPTECGANGFGSAGP